MSEIAKIIINKKEDIIVHNGVKYISTPLAEKCIFPGGNIQRGKKLFNDIDHILAFNDGHGKGGTKLLYWNEQQLLKKKEDINTIPEDLRSRIEPQLLNEVQESETCKLKAPKRKGYLSISDIQNIIKLSKNFIYNHIRDGSLERHGITFERLQNFDLDGMKKFYYLKQDLLPKLLALLNIKDPTEQLDLSTSHAPTLESKLKDLKDKTNSEIKEIRDIQNQLIEELHTLSLKLQSIESFISKLTSSLLP